MPESEGVDDKDLRWFTLDVDLESLSPHRSAAAGGVWAAGSSAQSSSGSSQQPPTGGISQGGRNKRPAVQLSLRDEDPTRHRDQPAGMQLATGRAQRQHRMHATNFRFRVFTNDHAKAALVAISRFDSAPPCISRRTSTGTSPSSSAIRGPMTPCSAGRAGRGSPQIPPPRRSSSRRPLAVLPAGPLTQACGAAGLR